jgi:hypothetical protein
MFLFRFMQKCSLSSSRAYCIFDQPANGNGFVQLPIHDFNNRTFWTFLLVDLRKMQYARDDERPHFCINLNNIDNEVNCDFIVMLTSFQTISSINYGVTSCLKNVYMCNVNLGNVSWAAQILHILLYLFEGFGEGYNFVLHLYSGI